MDLVSCARCGGRSCLRALIVLGAIACLSWCLFPPCSALAHSEGESTATFAAFPRGAVKRVGHTTYRYLPGRDEYEVRHRGQPPGFLHYDHVPRRNTRSAGSEPAYYEGPAVALPSNELAPVCRSSGNRIVVVYTHRSSDTK